MRASARPSLTRVSVRTLLALAAASSAVSAADLLVPQQFPSIQAAINSAVNGDTILVSPGSYSRVHFLGKSITLRSVAGPNVTTIDGGGTPGYVVTFSKPSSRSETGRSVLDGFTITGAAAPLSGGAPLGGGIRIDRTSPIITNSIITNNQGLFGGGLSVTGGNPEIVRSTFSGNRANSGGGIYAESSNITLTAVRFDGNSAVIDGGGLVIAGGRITLRDSVLTGNLAQSYGAALVLNHAYADIQFNEFKGNGSAQSIDQSITLNPFGGGALYTSGAVSGIFNANRLTGNAAYAGAGVYIAGVASGFKVSNTLISGNTGSLGVGVYINGQGSHLSNLTVVDNRSGGGVFITNGSISTIANSIISGHGLPNDGWDLTGGQTASLTLEASIVSGRVLSSAIRVGSRVRQLTNPTLDAAFAPTPGSPAIDAGVNSAVPTSILKDLAGNARFIDDPRTIDTGVGTPPLVDIGAFEFVPKIKTKSLSQRPSLHSAGAPTQDGNALPSR
jgi:predicted outer membrane repeat protein